MSNYKLIHTVIFEIKTLNVRSLTTSDLKLCRKKLTTFLEDQPSIAIFQETNQNHSGLIQLQRQFRYELGGYQVLLHHHRLIQQERKVRLTDQNFFIQRICNKEARFARSPAYMYAAIGYLEKKQLQIGRASCRERV